MEEASYPPETPYFGPNKNANLSELLKMELDHRSETIEEETTKKRKKTKRSKIKKDKSCIPEKLSPFTLNLDEDNLYYELLTKKIKLRNDFDKKHVEKLLAEAEEAFEGCDLDDKISGDES